MNSRGRHSGIAVAVVIGLLLTSCAAGSDGSPGAASSAGSSGSTATTPPATTGSGPTGSAPAATTGSPPASTEAPEDIPLPDRTPGRTKGRTITVTGTVEAGVEGSCVLLGRYLLLGGPRTALKPGNKVTVTGRLAQGLATTCQQGTPLAVERVTRAS